MFHEYSRGKKTIFIYWTKNDKWFHLSQLFIFGKDMEKVVQSRLNHLNSLSHKKGMAN